MGIKFEPYFCTQDPFTTKKWDKRDAKIINSKGQTVFELKNVEVPKDWSQLATNIVASKYFYSSQAGDVQETSVKQLVARVAGSISRWGYSDGYFDSDISYKSFERDLTWLLINQYGAFNSPVWFNVGIAHTYKLKPGDFSSFRYNGESNKIIPSEKNNEYGQSSACFIQSVDDNMDSIMNLARSESKLFKNGSGSGTDLSTLRSSKEAVSGGGTSSGPLSFLKIYDTVANVVKSAGRVRRAAKMNILSISHPDIKEFIFCKLEEDKKLKTLTEAGFIIDNASDFAFYQNVNLSVKITDKFMTAVEESKEWKTKLVTNQHKNGPTYDAKQLFNWIAEAAHSCGDPGLQFTDTINKWNTCTSTGIINCSNPCGEFYWHDNSACNLASLNLVKFMENGKFNFEKFINAIRVFIIAQDILVDRSSYPTEQIAQNSHDYRPLGLGHSNLGGLLMTLGIPYSSQRGRNIASVITSYMTCYSYEVSHILAEAKGVFTHYDANKESFAHVLTKHCEAASELVDDSIIPVSDLKSSWRRLTTLTGFRNSQVTLEAPCGTIGFMMDCDTTGIEPELGLVKYKAMSGGGTLTIINQTIETALKTLGYKDIEIKSIVDFILANGTIEGSELKSDHLSVFDCALKSPKGKRVLSWSDHVNMVAVIQPHLSGGISKTINMSSTDTIEDVKNAYMLAWKKGLKGITIYRDGSKQNQPLNLSKKKEDTKAKRQRLPETRDSVTHKFSVAGSEGYFTVGKFPDGLPGELFITIAKEGSTVGGLMDAFGTAISMCLQYGVPLKTLITKFSQSRFDPAGMTSSKDVPMCSSIIDYIFRWMKIHFIDKSIIDKHIVNKDEKSEQEIHELLPVETSGPMCSDCGSITVRNGSCHKCPNCGLSLGCS